MVALLGDGAPMRKSGTSGLRRCHIAPPGAKAETWVRREVLISLAFLVLPSLVMWLVLYPGYFQADHQKSIALIAAGEPSQWHSLVWGYFAFPFLYFAPSYACYGLVQIALFCAASFFSVWKLRKMGFVRSLVPLSALFGLFPTFLLYNLLYCSDIIFSYALMPLTVMLMEITITRGTALRSQRFCLGLLALVVLVCCLRKQAMLIPVALLVALPLLFRAVWRQGVLVVGGGLAIACLVNASFPALVGATPSPSQEMLSVPTTQIAYVVAHDGDIPEGIEEELYSLRSEEEWRDSYQSYSADKAKAGIKMSFDLIESWVILGFHNPGMYMQAYMQLMHPFWEFADTSLDPSAGYSCGSSIDFEDYDSMTIDVANEYEGDVSERYLVQFGQEKSDAWHVPSRLYELVNNSHLPMITDMTTMVLFNRALPLWVAVFGLAYALRQRFCREYLFVVLPVACTLVAFLCFAPVSLFRYAMEMYYTIPIILVFLLRYRRVASMRDASVLPARFVRCKRKLPVRR